MRARSGVSDTSSGRLHGRERPEPPYSQSLVSVIKYGRPPTRSRCSSRAAVRAASAGSARCDDLDEISGAIEEARRRNAPVGILLSLAKKLSVARQRASSKPAKMRTMQLEMEALPPSSDAGDEAAGWRSPRSIQRELDRELRFCSEAIAEAEWVRDFGDAAIAEAERLHAERHDEYTRETAVLTIQDAWRRRKAPALAAGLRHEGGGVGERVLVGGALETCF